MNVFPVPAPATMEILQNVPVSKGAVQKETTTPTGAAILKHYVTEFTNAPIFSIEKTSYGIGQSDFDIPNVLRVSLGKSLEESITDQSISIMLECNIDDMPAEHTEFVTDKLFKLGAQDVFYTPIIMKKGRPAIKLSILCNPNDMDGIKSCLFNDTTTIGLRQYEVHKFMLPRKIDEVDTPFGPIRVKICEWDNQIKYKAEFEDCQKASIHSGVSLQKVIQQINSIIEKQYHG